MLITYPEIVVTALVVCYITVFWILPESLTDMGDTYLEKVGFAHMFIGVCFIFGSIIAATIFMLYTLVEYLM